MTMYMKKYVCPWAFRVRVVVILFALFVAHCSLAKGQIIVKDRRKGMPSVTFTPTIGPSNAELLQRARARCDRAMREARAHIDAEKWYKARRAIDSARSSAYAKDQREAMLDLYVEINDAGMKQLDEAGELYDEGKYAQVLKAYSFISSAFSHLPAGVFARNRLKEARSDPLIAAKFGDDRAEKMSNSADKLIDSYFARYAKAQKKKDPKAEVASVPTARFAKIKLLDDTKLLSVTDILQRIVNKYPDTPSGMLAADDMSELKDDEVFWKRFTALTRSREADRLMSQGNMYFKNSLLKKAKEFYDKVVKEYADLPQAKKARTESIRIEVEIEEAQRKLQRRR